MSSLTLPWSGERPPARVFWDVGLLSAVLGCAHGLKTLYTTASPAELEPVLGPTAALVSLMTGHPFVPEANVGHVNHELATLIVPACAGINFLVIALCMTAFTVVPRAPGGLTKVALVLASAVVAYGATVLVNALRITAGIELGPLATDTGLGSPASVHRTLGVLVYLGALWVLYVGAERATRAGRAGAPDLALRRRA